MTVDLGDDAAVRPDGVVVTVDTLVEGVHFLQTTPAASLGAKVLAVSVSDVLAMGSVPEDAVLALSVRDEDPVWLEAFAEGLGRACARYEVDLIGGDTTSSPGPTVISLTLLGRLLGEPWRRDGARPGDRLLVSGTLGLAGAGWLDDAPSPAARQALADPSPPAPLPAAFHEAGVRVHAAMDLSDGLAIDAARLAVASQVALHIHPDALPATAEVAARPDRLRLQTCGGEDYQLLLVVPPSDVDAAIAAARSVGVVLTEIGQARAGSGAHLVGACWPDAAFTHFHQAPR